MCDSPIGPMAMGCVGCENAEGVIRPVRGHHGLTRRASRAPWVKARVAEEANPWHPPPRTTLRLHATDSENAALNRKEAPASGYWPRPLISTAGGRGSIPTAVFRAVGFRAAYRRIRSGITSRREGWVSAILVSGRPGGSPNVQPVRQRWRIGMDDAARPQNARTPLRPHRSNRRPHRYRDVLLPSPASRRSSALMGSYPMDAQEPVKRRFSDHPTHNRLPTGSIRVNTGKRRPSCVLGGLRWSRGSRRGDALPATRTGWSLCSAGPDTSISGPGTADPRIGVIPAYRHQELP